MRGVKGYTYESALKEEKELEVKIQKELEEIGKLELWQDVKQYAVAFAIRLSLKTFQEDKTNKSKMED